MDDRDFELQMALIRWEIARAAEEANLADEADELIAALEDGRPVISATGWGTAELVDDLRERVAAAAAFPATPWWRGEGGSP